MPIRVDLAEEPSDEEYEAYVAGKVRFPTRAERRRMSLKDRRKFSRWALWDRRRVSLLKEGFTPTQADFHSKRRIASKRTLRMRRHHSSFLRRLSAEQREMYNEQMDLYFDSREYVRRMKEYNVWSPKAAEDGEEDELGKIERDLWQRAKEGELFEDK